MGTEVDVAVVGSGAFGASVAFHLADRGLRIALIDQFALGSQTSPRAAGLTNQVRQNPALAWLATRSVEKILNFKDETGEDLQYHQTGGITVARDERYAASAYEDIRYAQKRGLEVNKVSKVEARGLAPFLEPAGASSMWYTPSDVYLEPRRLVDGYIRAAANRGATLIPNTRVIEILLSDGEVVGAETSSGTIGAGCVVDAGGAWLGLLAKTAGANIPVVPTRHQLYITHPMGIDLNGPIVRVLDDNVYVRPENGGLMFGGYEEKPLQVDMETLPADFEISDVQLDLEPLKQLTMRTREMFPSLREATVAEFRGGLPTMTADGRPIIDRVPEVEGLFVVGGCCVGGLSISPGVGECVARWVLGERAAVDLSTLGLERFSEEGRDKSGLQEACRHAYAHTYAS